MSVENLQYVLKCKKCGKEYEGFRLTCECSHTLTIEWELPLNVSFDDITDKTYPDMRRYAAVLPIFHEYIPSISVPITPVIEKRIGNVTVFFKLEYAMPTGSFKDRGTWVTISKLKEEGIKEVSLDSSGNAAISLAAFSALEGIKAHIYIPKSTSEGKKIILRNLGADVIEVEGSRDRVHEVAIEDKKGEYISHWINPFFIEGTKTVAFEAYEQIGDIDYAISPVGSGTLFLGLFKGFSELYEMGLINKIPHMIAAQAAGYESVSEKRRNKESTLAEGIAIKNPPRRDEIVEAIKITEGTGIAVIDEEIMEALRELYRYGFIVEPTSAVAYSVFKKLAVEGYFEENSKILLPLTGSGLKSKIHL